MPKTMCIDKPKSFWALCCLCLLLSGCPRGPRLPTQPDVGGLVAYDYSGMTVMHQFSDRDYIHMRLHFGWQRPEESSFATQSIAVETAFAGGAGTYSTKAFARKWESLGATLQFLQTPEGPVVLIDCLPEQLTATWELVSLCLTEPLFEKSTYLALRARRISAFKAAQADRSQQALQSALQGAWPQDLEVATDSSAGRLEDVALTTVQLTFRDLMRQRCNIRLITIGPIDAERISDLLLETVDALPEGPCAPSHRDRIAPKMGQAMLVHEVRGSQALAGIFPGPAISSAQTVEMRLVMHMVEQRLHDKLVLHDKLASKLEARYVGTFPGYNLIQITGGNAFQCAEFALSELRKLRTYGFLSAEVAAAQQSMRTQISLGYESATSLAARLDATAAAEIPNLAGNEIPLLEACDARSCTAMLKLYLAGISWGMVGDTTGVDRKSLHRL